MKPTALIVVLSLSLTAACQNREQPAPAVTPAVNEAPAAKAPAAKAPPAASPDETKKEPLSLGAKLTGAEVIKVAELQAKAQELDGKTVALAGNVAGMCHHRKRWFSVVDDQSGTQLRVMTMPAFQVPEGVIGRKVVVEGTVAQLEIPAERARHMAKEHKLRDPQSITGEVFQETVLRATAARFE